MRALFIELFAPAIESLLLRQQVRAGGPAAFGLHRAVHAFMRSVVLRASGAGELDIDPQADPPDAQPAQSAGPHRREGAAVIDSNDIRKPVNAENRVETLSCRFDGLLLLRLDAQEVLTMKIRQGERIATNVVLKSKPAFEISRPDVIAPLSRGQ